MQAGTLEWGFINNAYMSEEKYKKARNKMSLL